MRRLVPLILVVWLASCSPPSFVAQRYSNFTAYYNTFHNAQDAFQSGIASLESADAPVDQNRFLPVFVPPDRVGGGQDFTQAIRKSADILRDHPNSKWVDDALLLIGKSYFYQQNYVGAAQKFREAIVLETALEGEARFWLARALIGAGNYPAAAEHLGASLDGEDASFGRWTDMMQLARGELLARQEQWQEAAVALERGLEGRPDERPAARAAFLLGQVREQIGTFNAAARAFEVVNEAYQPRYELSFAARVNALRIRGLHGDTEEALRRVRRMERDDKNFEKRFELMLLRGQLHQANGQASEARRIFRAMLYEDEPIARGVQGQAHYALGTLHQEAYSDFSAAAAHFDTASTTLGSSIATSAEAMGESPAAITDSRSRADLFRNLADKSALVRRADSLLELGALSDEDFAEAIAAIRQQRAEEEAQRRRQAERRQARQQFGSTQPRIQQRPQTQQTTNTNGSENAGFLFHQSAVRAQEARSTFERRWGTRPLVPNWRRLEAIAAQGASSDEAETVTEEASEDAAAPGVAPLRAASVDISAVPRDSASRAQMRARRAIARYEFANALFLTAGRPDSAAYWYQRVIEEDAGQPVARRALYALAEVRQAQGDTVAAQNLYQRIIEAHPDSRFAHRARQQLGQRALPAAADSSAQAEAAYEQAYTTWQNGRPGPAVHQFVDVAVDHAGTPIAAKALWAAATLFMQEHAHRKLHMRTPLPLVFGRVLGGPDSTAGLQSSRVPTIGSLLIAQPTLGKLLNYIITHYPEAPQTQRAERLIAALEARTGPPADSLARIDSTTIDSTAIDSAAADSATIAVAPDSVGADSVGTPPVALQAAPDTASADTAQVGAAPARPAWAIILATRDGRDVASNLLRVYQSRFESEGLSVRVRAVEAAGTTQYQVVLGSFASEQDAAAIMQRFRMRMPGTARVERIQ